MSVVLSVVTPLTEKLKPNLTNKFCFTLYFDLVLVVNYFYDFRECANILHHRDWSDEAHKTHFESGVRMGIGTFNLVCLSSFVVQNYY